MKFVLSETVFTYPKVLLDAWKEGKKDWIPDSLLVPQDVYNQPHYHFGEYYALTKYLELGWEGTAFYALGDWEPNNDKYEHGRAMVAKYMHPIRLAMFKSLRQGLTSGEPDLFLYKEDGSVMFVEVKKETDRVSKSQLICMEQIKSILACDVAVVYLSEENKVYTPKSYELNVVSVPQTWIERN
ncbi:VRR-NUC domain-containing protein [Vibrio porteresiae]|uniref:VRR-NUC domain-containing protein n=1 Tax=Vibrio porteresiae DSM 19223 TaxID=1123496 RepID=A0ABZ0QKI0_9VIBR|nr:VRR-NUC domain-containing protein [Vibrio porteresiae]WPC75933.1 VRR-NUC domain-containing protein [Vibrio porteresiae DSM 19223]